MRRLQFWACREWGFEPVKSYDHIRTIAVGTIGVGGFACSRVWRKIHLYLGLLAGVMFAFSGLSGSALVFYQDIDEYLNPALLTVEPDRDYVPLTEIIATAQKVVSADAKLARLYLPRHSRAAMKVRFTAPENSKDVLLDVIVNPFTAEVLGQRRWGGYLMSFIYKLHYTLVLGEVGKTIVGVIGLLLMCLLLSGLYLWWPGFSKLFQALRFKRSTNRLRFLYDLHKTIGIYAAAVLIVIVFSGIYMIFPHYVKPLIGVVLPFTETIPTGFSMDEGNGKKRINIDEVGRIASDLFPQAKLQRIYFPVSVDGVYHIIMRHLGEIRKTRGSTQLWINPYDGKVLAVQKPQAMRGGDVFIAWMFPLHNGEAFGLSGRIIVFVMGFIPIILYVTGLIVWWRKREARMR
ncbi:MAG: peptidase M4 [Methylophaga sp.]|nr:MAG: peptidase M4 [Methylophaga sp.]